jgi:hypothetical protein
MTAEREQVQTTADIAYGDEGDQEENAAATAAADGQTGTDLEAAATPLLSEARSDELNQRWMTIQGTFVDAPREAVQNADSLVAEVIQDLAKTFADERASLEQQWEQSEDVDTEALRVALQRYRSFFQRLLAA